MALWEQLHTTSTTINWRTLESPKSQQFISRGISLSPSEQTQSTHCCLQPGVTDFPVWKKCIPQKLFKSRCSFLYLWQPLQSAEGAQRHFASPQISRKIGVKICFVSGTHSSRELIHRTASNSLHTIIESSLNLTALLNGLVSSGIPGTKAFE